MSLVAAALERRGIPTVVLQLLRMVTEKVRPPRALFVPFKHGFPLGLPGRPEVQLRVLEAALQLFERPDPVPFIIDYAP
ncbi:MAG TPA: hypothetical protein ENK02_09600 [Planctomycetes bacterium]|nr:hypothetical protein [Planctomycetota bacterium]